LIRATPKDSILRTFVLFVQAAESTTKYANAHFHKGAGLSTIKFMVLHYLADNGGTMTPSEIAKRTLRERHNITTLVNRLERDGFVAAERSAKDRRSVNITLTDKGREMLWQATPVAWDIVNQVMLSITEGDVVLLKKLLGALRQNAHHGLQNVTKHSESCWCRVAASSHPD
jgi:DNA-binding MarR family transcriptional regulator